MGGSVSRRKSGFLNGVGRAGGGCRTGTGIGTTGTRTGAGILRRGMTLRRITRWMNERVILAGAGTCAHAGSMYISTGALLYLVVSASQTMLILWQCILGRSHTPRVYVRVWAPDGTASTCASAGEAQPGSGTEMKHALLPSRYARLPMCRRRRRPSCTPPSA